MSGAGESMGGGSGGLKDKIKLITGDTGDLEAGIKLEVWVDRATTQLLLAVASMQPQNQRYKGQASTFLDFQNSALYPSTILTDYVFIESENDLYRLASIGAGGVKNWTSLKQDLKSRIDILEAFIDDESDVDGIVNKVAEVLKVFENYPEGVNILQEFNDIKASIPLKADTLTTYAKTDVDALLDAKENVLYDVRATEGIIFNLTHLDYVDKLAFATDTNKVFQGCLADGALYWSCANGGEMTFSATLTPNQVKNISLFSPIKYKSEYALNMLVVATAGGLENRISARMFHVYGQNSGYINKISTRTNDSQETTLCEVSSTTSIVNNQIQMQLSNKSSQNISIQCYIN